jgi:hypothetical protein
LEKKERQTYIAVEDKNYYCSVDVAEPEKLDQIACAGEIVSVENTIVVAVEVVVEKEVVVAVVAVVAAAVVAAAAAAAAAAVAAAAVAVAAVAVAAVDVAVVVRKEKVVAADAETVETENIAVVTSENTIEFVTSEFALEIENFVHLN